MVVVELDVFLIVNASTAVESHPAAFVNILVYEPVAVYVSPFHV